MELLGTLSRGGGGVGGGKREYEGLKLEDRLATIHGKCPEIPSTLRLVDTAQELWLIDL